MSAGFADLILSQATRAASPTSPMLAAAKSPAKAREAAQEFEAVFLNSMMQQMFAGLEGDGPMGGNGATGVWRSMLTDEYAKSFAKNGGIGIADEVYRTLLAQQEAVRS